MGGCCFHVIVDYTIPCFIVAQKNRINNFIIIGQLICTHTYLSFWITEESFVLGVDIGLLCNLFFVKCVLFIGKLFSTVLVLGLQVPTLGIGLNFVSTNKLIIDLFSSPGVVKQITSITIEPGVEVEVTIADSWTWPILEISLFWSSLVS